MPVGVLEIFWEWELFLTLECETGEGDAEDDNA